MSLAKDKCNEHLENPDSKVNAMLSAKGILIKAVLGPENKTDDEKNSSITDKPCEQDNFEATVEEL